MVLIHPAGREIQFLLNQAGQEVSHVADGALRGARADLNLAEGRIGTFFANSLGNCGKAAALIDKPEKIFPSNFSNNFHSLKVFLCVKPNLFNAWYRSYIYLSFFYLECIVTLIVLIGNSLAGYLKRSI